MFVPLTPGGSLRKRLTEIEDSLRQPTKMKYVEQMGSTLSALYVTKDPWATMGCGRPKCLPCVTQPGKCLKQGALYTLTCGKWKEKGVKALYYGESALWICGGLLAIPTLIQVKSFLK